MEGTSMKQMIFIETGTGIDVHGQDVNEAATRAVMDAIHYNSMPGMRTSLPEGDINNMKGNGKLAIPKDLEKLQQDKSKALIPYGQATGEVTEGGKASTKRRFT